MVKQAELAGSWYPGTKSELQQMISGFMENANSPEIEGRAIGIISPHAGLVYSGQTAAYGYKLFAREREKYANSTVIIIGLNHRNAGFSGISVWAEGAWASPLGQTSIDEALADSILKALGDSGSFRKDVYRGENSLETQLPFIQYAFGPSVKIVPIIFGTQSVQASILLAEVLSHHASREDIVIVASTDLSHYHSSDSAKTLDQSFIDAVTSWEPESLISRLQSGRCEACGFGTVLTLMFCARGFGADKVFELNSSNSGESPQGDETSVVGYLSAAFMDSKHNVNKQIDETNNAENINSEYSLSEKQKKYLLQLARRTIEDYINKEEIYSPKLPGDEQLKADGAVFVTLHQDGQLRGCIGQMIAQGPLYLAVRDMAISAAVNDHRFRPVGQDELDKIDIEISVLSPMQEIDDWHKIEIGKHGVWLRKGFNSGVFLPQVGRDTGWSREQFLEELSSQKAGLSRNAYRDSSTQLYIFTVVEFDEGEFGLR